MPAQAPARPAPARPAPARARSGKSAKAPAGPRPTSEHEILFQKYFKSVGPRTYAAQVKRATNRNHYLVLTEGQRDPKTDELRKTRLFLFSEDFAEFFRMMHDVAVFIRDNPVPEDIKRKRERFWAKANQPGGNAGGAAKRSPEPSPAGAPGDRKSTRLN